MSELSNSTLYSNHLEEYTYNNETFQFHVMKYGPKGRRIGRHIFSVSNRMFENWKAKLTKDSQIRIAGFDLDDTLITNISDTTWGTGPDDWKLFYPTLEQKLKEFSRMNSDTVPLIVIFSNQGAISNMPSSRSLAAFAYKVRNVVKALNGKTPLPIIFYAATNPGRKSPAFEKKLETVTRKPSDGMFVQLLMDLGITRDSISFEDSFFCGDAAGRPGDHSDCDKGLASSLGVKFYTPEQYFLEEQ